jgi:hypothetical protein
MRVEKFLLTPRLDPELNDIESSHRDVSQLDLAAHFARGILDLALCRRECILDRDHDVLVFGRIAVSFADEDILMLRHRDANIDLEQIAVLDRRCPHDGRNMVLRPAVSSRRRSEIQTGPDLRSANGTLTRAIPQWSRVRISAPRRP